MADEGRLGRLWGTCLPSLLAVAWALNSGRGGRAFQVEVRQGWGHGSQASGLSSSILGLSSLGQVVPSKDRTEPILLGGHDGMVPESQHLEAEAGGYL